MAKEKKNNRRKRRFYKRKRLWIFLMLCGIAALYGLREAKVRLKPYQDQADAIDISTIDDVEVASRILDRHGQEIGRMFVENRKKTTIDKIPQKLIDALIAQEDQRFFEHDGVDRIGVARAVYLNLKAGEVTQGASTITMQLARNAFDLKGAAKRRNQKSMERKIVEAFLALRIEKALMKEMEADYPDEDERKTQMKRRVLEMYLNRIPFGTGFYGVHSAALGYFGKEPMDLTIEECASLVACVKNPAEISPLRNKKKNRVARDHVLKRMLAEGMITESEWLNLSSKVVTLNPKPIVRRKSNLYELIIEQALDVMGTEGMSQGGFKIFTTIDRDLQRRAEISLRDQLDRIEQMPGYSNPRREDFSPAPGTVPEYLQGAVFMIESSTGNVLAHVGGRDFAHSQYDFIELGKRPFGTAFLPMVYAAALDNGYHPCSTVRDEAIDARMVMVGGEEGILGEWGMEHSRPRYEGRITNRRALAASKLAAAIRIGRRVGLPEVAKQAANFGIPVDEEDLLNRMLLGWDQVSLKEVVKAYSAFGNGGIAPTQLRYVSKIENSAGEVVYQSDLPALEERTRRVCDEITAFQVHDMMQDSLESGNLEREADMLAEQPFHGAVKTGTTHDFADGWSVGYNGNVTLGVWVGFHQGRKAIYPEAFGRDLTFKPWSDVMNVAAEHYAGEQVKAPKGVEPVRVCSRSGLLATRYCYESAETPGQGARVRYTGISEMVRVEREKLGLCDLHGKGGIGTNEVLERYGPMAVDVGDRKHLSVAPILPETSGLIGEDPYGAEVVALDEAKEEISVFVRSPTLMLDAEVLTQGDTSLRLRRPRKIEIKTD